MPRGGEENRGAGSSWGGGASGSRLGREIQALSPLTAKNRASMAVPRLSWLKVAEGRDGSLPRARRSMRAAHAAVPCLCLVPADAAGLIVGRGGEGLRRFRESGGDVTVLPAAEAPPTLADRVVTVTGTALQKERTCRSLITRLRQAQRVRPGEEAVFVAVVPGSSVSTIVGDRGAQIREVAEKSGAEVIVSRECIHGTSHWPVSITGDIDSVVAAATHIDAIVQRLADAGGLSAAHLQFGGGGGNGEGEGAGRLRSTSPPTSLAEKARAGAGDAATRTRSWLSGRSHSADESLHAGRAQVFAMATPRTERSTRPQPQEEATPPPHARPPRQQPPPGRPARVSRGEI